MAETCGVRPDDASETAHAAETRLKVCARQRRALSGPPVGFVPVERYLRLDQPQARHAGARLLPAAGRPHPQARAHQSRSRLVVDPKRA
jgi:hypothetical protein